MYTILVNKRPQLKSKNPCFPFPHKGTALKTKFQIKCDPDQIRDEDVPFVYYWFYKSKKAIWKTITYPSEGTYFRLV